MICKPTNDPLYSVYDSETNYFGCMSKNFGMFIKLERTDDLDGFFSHLLQKSNYLKILDFKGNTYYVSDGGDDDWYEEL